MSRLTAYAEENRENIELLTAIREEAIRRAAPTTEELVTRIDGLLAALGIFDEDEASAAPDLAARLEAMAIELRTVRDKLSRAEHRAVEAETRARTAERQVVELSATVAKHATNGFHERVHLAPSAPDWLVEAAQRAFRLRFHPDRFADPDKKSKAEAVFKEAEQVFARLRSAGETVHQA